MGILSKIFSPIIKLLSLIFKKREKKAPEKKTAHERVQDSYFIRIKGNLLRLRNRINVVRNEEAVKEARRQLEELRREFWHINRKQRSYLAGIFAQCEARIKSLEKKFRQLKRKEERLARRAA